MILLNSSPRFSTVLIMIVMFFLKIRSVLMSLIENEKWKRNTPIISCGPMASAGVQQLFYFLVIDFFSEIQIESSYYFLQQTILCRMTTSRVFSSKRISPASFAAPFALIALFRQNNNKPPSRLTCLFYRTNSPLLCQQIRRYFTIKIVFTLFDANRTSRI